MVSASRVVAARVYIPGDTSVVCYSGYLKDGEGWGPVNTRLAAELGSHVRRQTGQVLCGCDWNMSPESVAQQSFHDKAGCVLTTPEHGVPTFVTTRAKSTIDFFMVGKPLVHAVKSIEVMLDSGITPHRPVKVVFHERILRLRYMQMRRPPVLPTQLPCLGQLPGPSVGTASAAELRALSKLLPLVPSVASSACKRLIASIDASP